MLSSLAGRAYIVSGGLSGIGLATTLRLLASGAHVWVADIGSKPPDQLTARSHLKNIHIPESATDIRVREKCNELTRAVVRRHGRIDGVINCAGLCLPEPIALEGLDAVFQKELDVNVRGTWNLATEAMLQMESQEKKELAGRGSVVNVCSIAALKGLPALSVYCMTKHAVLGLTRSWAVERARAGIRVNAVAPGVTNTPMYHAQLQHGESDEMARNLEASIPMGRIAKPEEIAATICFLLSDEASYITGQIHTVSGGA